MFSKTFLLLAAVPALAFPMGLTARADCSEIHIFGARETNSINAPYGLTINYINDIKAGFSDVTFEAIDYPANGTVNGKTGYTSPDYKKSVQAGVKAVTKQVSAYAKACPNAKLILIGYSQGAKLFDDALCGGGDPNMGITDTAATIAQFNVKAVLLPGDDRYTPGENNAGNATVGGYDKRPSDQTSCGEYHDAIQIYCDSPDEFCSNGQNDIGLKTHNGYHARYGKVALQFVKDRLK